MAGEKGKRRKRKPDNPAQSRKFLEAAKKLGLVSGDAFNRAMDKIAPKKRGKNGNN